MKDLDVKDLFCTAKENYSTTIAKGKITKIQKKGRVKQGKVLKQAIVELSLGPEAVIIKFPRDISQPFAEIKQHLKSRETEGCFKVAGREYSETISAKQIIEVKEHGTIKDGMLEQPAKIILSKGPAPQIDFPKSLGLTLEEAKNEIREELSSEFMLEYAFQINGEEHSDAYLLRPRLI